MIKGIISLFTSGLIFNPLVLLGIVCGIISITKLNQEQLIAIAKDPNSYILVVFAAFLYAFIFKKRYKEGGISIDYTAMLFTVVGGTIKFILSYILSISFVVMLGF